MGSPTYGVYAVKGGAFVETIDGKLWFCTSGGGAGSPIALPPSGTDGYQGMGGIRESTLGIVLVLISYVNNGFWFCFGATTTGCTVESNFISLPSTFCKSLSAGYCDPGGAALDKNLNVYYVDISSAVVAKCTYSSSYKVCTVIENLSGNPFGIFRDPSNGDLWVTDLSCNGHVWKNGVIKYTLNDTLEGITMSAANPSKIPHLYVGVVALCGTFSFSTIYDVMDKTIVTPLGKPFSGSNDIPAISTKLQFTSGSIDKVFVTKDNI